MSVSFADVSRFYGSTLSNKKERSEVTDSNISPKKVSDMRKRSEVTASHISPKKVSDKRKISEVTDSHISHKKVSDKKKRSKVTDSHISSKKVSDKKKRSEVTDSHLSPMKVKVGVCHLINPSSDVGVCSNLRHLKLRTLQLWVSCLVGLKPVAMLHQPILNWEEGMSLKSIISCKLQTSNLSNFSFYHYDFLNGTFPQILSHKHSI